MNNYEGSRSLMSSHKCQEQPSSAMTTQEYGVMVPNKLMSTYKYKYMSMALTALMHTHTNITMVTSSSGLMIVGFSMVERLIFGD